MKNQRTLLFLAAGLLCGPTLARTWETPVMATWTEDPRTSVTLAWERHAEGIGRVDCKDADGGLVCGATESAASRRHVFTLRELEPGTRYDYTVSSSDGYEAQGRFWTAPADKNQPFTFVLHNDLQGGINVAAAKTVSAGVVAANPDFVLSTGDLADPRYAGDYAGAIGSWNLFFECLRDELAAGVFQPVSGNHDEPENPDSFWHRLFELPDAHDYVLDVGPIRFLLLDSTEFQAPSRTAWLARELQKAAFDPAVTWTIPAFHRPPFSEGERGGDAGLREWWVPLFTKYEADLVLSGHAHGYQRMQPIEGVPYLVSGGGGGWLYQVDPAHPHVAFATSACHFVEFRVEGPAIRLAAKTPDGTVFDRAEYAARRHVRVAPVFPARGEPCTIRYDAQGGPLADSAQVTLHLGRDEFTGGLLDVPMERDAATGEWTATFAVPESPKWHLAFCFFDPERNRWHDTHARNWQALV
ncbi:MAG: metallophosphoesterase, partial [Kiritimatiellia bacterium]